jgi:hypothetical protein
LPVFQSLDVGVNSDFQIGDSLECFIPLVPVFQSLGLAGNRGCASFFCFESFLGFAFESIKASVQNSGSICGFLSWWLFILAPFYPVHHLFWPPFILAILSFLMGVF